MVILQFNGRQYTITIAPSHIKRMGWKRGTNLYIAKDPNQNSLYIEEIKREAKK